jgi:hypothetical protein
MLISEGDGFMVAPFTVGSSIPDAVQKSLDAGIFERVGGVIREVLSGRVIAFLRETASVENLAPLLTASGATALGVLNLSLATMGFAVVLKRINGIQHRLQQTQDVLTKLDQKIDLSFFANLCAALDLAHDAFTLVRPENRESAARQSVDRLAEARHYYSAVATSTLNASGPAVDAYLATLTLTAVAEARCYLELEELNRATQRLQTAAAAIQPHVRSHVTTLLTANPAAYLHPSLKDRVDLSRLTKVLNWLTPGLDENAVFELPKFGHIEVPSWLGKLPMLGKAADSTALERLPAAMDTMEGMIEDMRRFEGYCTEVEAIADAGVSFREWQSVAVATSGVADAAPLHYLQLQQPLAGA